MVERSYVDVNVFVYWLGGHPVHGARAMEWIDRIARSPRGSFLTSSLTLYEVVILAGLAGRSLKDSELVGVVAAALKEPRGWRWPRWRSATSRAQSS